MMHYYAFMFPAVEEIIQICFILMNFNIKMLYTQQLNVFVIVIQLNSIPV